MTGWPSQGAQSVSVLAANTTTAGAMSTIAMLKGDDGVPWLNSESASYLLVQHDGEIVSQTSSGVDPASVPS